MIPHPKKYLLDLKFNNYEFEQQKKMPVDTSENITKKSERHGELLEKRKTIFKEYRTNMIKGYKEVIGFDKKYKVYMKKYILKISAELKLHTTMAHKA